MRVSGAGLAVVLGMLLLPPGASANDTAASVGAGGLVLEKNQDIEMVSEVLEISTGKIRVTYHFLNASDKDIRTTVAFPMPAYTYFGQEENDAPLQSFRMSVNGKDVPVKKQRVFLIDGVDVTGKLRKLGLSDEQVFDRGKECLNDMVTYPNDFTIESCSLTKKQISGIHDLGGNLWEIQETAYWDQVFPARKEMKVVHEYEPFAGFNDSTSDPQGKGCLDAGTKRLLAKRSAENEGARFILSEVKYILGTGRNWRGPIKHFKLIIKKDDPADVVTLCFPGKAAKTSPTTIEFTQSDYVPQDQLDIFFYRY